MAHTAAPVAGIVSTADLSASALFSDVDDATLRDIGLHRSQITYVARRLAATKRRPASASGTPLGECAAMDYILAQARTEFPSLAQKRLNSGRCSLRMRASMSSRRRNMGESFGGCVRSGPGRATC